MNIAKLFDYQKFEENEKLEGIIENVEAKYYKSAKKELSFDEMSFVAAAGATKSTDENIDEINK